MRTIDVLDLLEPTDDIVATNKNFATLTESALVARA